MAQVVDRNGRWEWSEGDVAAIFYLPLNDVLPVQDGHKEAIRRAPADGIGRFAAAYVAAEHRRELLGPLDVSLRFYRVPFDMPDTALGVVLHIASLCWRDEWGVDEEAIKALETRSRLTPAERMVVEAVVPLAVDDHVLSRDREAPEFVSSADDALKRAFSAVQRFQAGVAFATNQVVRPLTYWTCPSPVVLYGIRRKDATARTIQPLTPIWLEDQYLGHALREERRSTIASENEWRRVQWMWQAKDREEPIVRVLELRQEVLRFALVEGELVAAIALLHSANDVLVGQTMRCLLWEEGKDPAAARQLLSDGRNHAAAIVKSQLPPRLGGRWGFDQSGPIRDWYRDCHLLRQRVLHGGEIPTVEAFDAAFTASRGLERYLATRLMAKGSTYPRTAALMAAWTAASERPQVQDAIATVDEWYARYQRWRFQLTEREPGDGGASLLWITCRPDAEPIVFVHREASFGVGIVDHALLPDWLDRLALETKQMASTANRLQARLVVCRQSEMPPVDQWLGDWEFDPELFPTSPSEAMPDVCRGFALPLRDEHV